MDHEYYYVIQREKKENFDVDLKKEKQFIIDKYKTILSISCACVLLRTNKKVTNII